MARTLVALYEDLTDAQDAVSDLVDNDVPREAISLIVRAEAGHARAVAEPAPTEKSSTAERSPRSAGEDAPDARLGAPSMLTLPGLGAIVAAGPLASSLTAIGAHAGIGALTHALFDMGLPDDLSEWYAIGVSRGGALVAVRAPEAVADDAIEILEDYEPVDIRRRMEEWRAEGWRPAGRP